MTPHFVFAVPSQNADLHSRHFWAPVKCQLIPGEVPKTSAYFLTNQMLKHHKFHMGFFMPINPRPPKNQRYFSPQGLATIALISPWNIWKLQPFKPFFQWLFQVPLKGGRGHITPQKAIYKWYILPIGGLYATYHLLGEPETTIEFLGFLFNAKLLKVPNGTKGWALEHF